MRHKHIKFQIKSSFCIHECHKQRQKIKLSMLNRSLYSSVTYLKLINSSTGKHEKYLLIKRKTHIHIFDYFCFSPFFLPTLKESYRWSQIIKNCFKPKVKIKQILKVMWLVFYTLYLKQVCRCSNIYLYNNLQITRDEEKKWTQSTQRVYNLKEKQNTKC